MIKRVVTGVGVLALVCMPYTFFPENPDWFRLDASWAAPGHSGDGGNNGNHTGMGGGGSNGQGGGDGGQGGHGGHGGGDGGNGGGNHGGGDGGHGGGGTAGGGGSTPGGGVSAGSGGAGSAASVSVSGPDGATGSSVSTGQAGYGDREHLRLVIRMCEMSRPGLAIGDTDGNGGWSFRTFDDTVWPYVQRCMADHGYPAYGTDFHNTTNFGSR